MRRPASAVVDQAPANQLMLRDLWEWWMEGLAGPWPDQLRRWLRGQRRTVWARDAGNGFEFLRRRRGTWHTLWNDVENRSMPSGVRRQLRAADIVVRVPEHCILKRTIAVPPECPAGDYVKRRLDEFSPFPEDQTCFDVVRPTGGSAVLVMARRDDIDDRLQRLRNAGLCTRRVTVEDLEHTPLDLMPDEQRPGARRDFAGAAVLAAALVACAAVPAAAFMEQSRALEQLQAEKTRLERRLASVNDTRKRIQQLRARAALVSKHGATRPDAVTLMSEVTRAVPDHSWVRQMVLNDGKLTLQGESGDTADLITRLEAASRLRNVRYEAAITHDADSGTDRFKLTADIVPQGS